MSQSQDPNLLLGKLAVHYKVLPKERVSQALSSWRQSGGGDFGSFLVDSGVLAPEMLQKLQRAREKVLAKQADVAPPVAQPASAAPHPAAPHPAAPHPAAPHPAAPHPAAPHPAAPQPAATRPAASPSAVPPSGPSPRPTTPSSAAPAPSPRPATASPVGSSAPIVSSPDDLLQLGAGQGLRELLAQAMRLGASDLHVHSQAPLRLRLHGELRDAGPELDAAQARDLILGILDEGQRALLEERQQLDFSYAIEGVGRFRSNAYEQQRGLDAVFRTIPFEPPTLADLGLPEDLERVIDFHQGIVLFTGPAGCGKSSTMAAMVRKINEDRPDHILTVEDPIEYVHTSQRCVVNQREVGPHTESFARALRAALREDPDIIAIGELRDLETISLALTAAETGHLVLGTLHTSSAIRTINRLLGVFPPDQQNQIRTMVSESLRAVVSQRLVPKTDGSGRVAALEVLMNTRAVGNLIREQKTFQIQSQMQTGGARGMRLLDNSLQELVQTGVIAREVAHANAEDRKRFAARA